MRNDITVERCGISEKELNEILGEEYTTMEKEREEVPYYMDDIHDLERELDQVFFEEPVKEEVKEPVIIRLTEIDKHYISGNEVA